MVASQIANVIYRTFLLQAKIFFGVECFIAVHAENHVCSLVTSDEMFDI